MVLQSIEELSKFYCTGEVHALATARILAQQRSKGVLYHT